MSMTIERLPNFKGKKTYIDAAEKGKEIVGGEKLTVTDTVLIGLCNKIYELEQNSRNITDDEIVDKFFNAGGVFNGITVTNDGNITSFRIDEKPLIKFIRG